MKIFYAVQATGNGHISRAMELLPHLRRIGEVDIFLSGSNSNLALDAPVKYRSKGISLFYNCQGGLDYWQIVRGLHPARIREDIRDLPVEKYDLVINDFDYITSAACARKKIPSVHFGHQASFRSPDTPRPFKKNHSAEWLLKNYVTATHHIGLHFHSYDHFIYGPVIKADILAAEPFNQQHITVYLPSYCEPQLEKIFMDFPDTVFEIFSKETTGIRKVKNIRFIPVDKKMFNNSLINCAGIICGAGFETPAEALQLGKKIMAIPIRGQYEQQCNAEALKQMGVSTLPTLGDDFATYFYNWMQLPYAIQKDFSDTIPRCIERLMTIAEKHIRKNECMDALEGNAQTERNLTRHSLKVG